MSNIYPVTVYVKLVHVSYHKRTLIIGLDTHTVDTYNGDKIGLHLENIMQFLKRYLGVTAAIENKMINLGNGRGQEPRRCIVLNGDHVGKVRDFLILSNIVDPRSLAKNML